jgi:hypothetical protein
VSTLEAGVCDDRHQAMLEAAESLVAPGLVPGAVTRTRWRSWRFPLGVVTRSCGQWSPDASQEHVQRPNAGHKTRRYLFEQRFQTAMILVIETNPGHIGPGLVTYGWLPTAGYALTGASISSVMSRVAFRICCQAGAPSFAKITLPLRPTITTERWMPSPSGLMAP